MRFICVTQGHAAENTEAFREPQYFTDLASDYCERCLGAGIKASSSRRNHQCLRKHADFQGTTLHSFLDTYNKTHWGAEK